jgi:hypothetical protein
MPANTVHRKMCVDYVQIMQHFLTLYGDGTSHGWGITMVTEALLCINTTQPLLNIRSVLPALWGIFLSCFPKPKSSSNVQKWTLHLSRISSPFKCSTWSCSTLFSHPGPNSTSKYLLFLIGSILWTNLQACTRWVHSFHLSSLNTPSIISL